MSQLRVRTWETWIEGDEDNIMESESLFPATAASEVGRRYCTLGSQLTVCVREKGTETTTRFRVEAYVEMATHEIKQGTN